MRDPFLSRRGAVRLARVSMGGALMCLLSPFSVPLPGGVPLTLGGFAAVFLGLILGPGEGAGAVALYLMLGSAGLPVFSGGTGGVGHLAGATGGYLFGFLFLAFFSGLFRGQKRALPGVLAGEAALYVLGTLWYLLFTGKDFFSSLLACCVPFLPGDAIKCALALYLYRLFRRRFRRGEARSFEKEQKEE